MGVKVAVMNNAALCLISLFNIGPHRGRVYNVSLTKAEQCINERDLKAKLDLPFSKGWWHLPIGIRRAQVGNQDVWKKTGEEKCNPSPPQHSSSNLKVLQQVKQLILWLAITKYFQLVVGPLQCICLRRKLYVWMIDSLSHSECHCYIC